MTESDGRERQEERADVAEDREGQATSGNHLPGDVDDHVRQAERIAEEAIQATDG